MNLDEALKGRRSIRKYRRARVPVSLLREVIAAATLAPSAHNGQQWRFSVLIGKSKRQLTDLFRRETESLSKRVGLEGTGSSFESCSIMEEAPVVIMVWNAGHRGHETEIQSVAAAIENMLLKAYALGLGTLWIGDIFDIPIEKLQKHLNKPWKLTAAVALGWPGEEPKPRPRKPVNEVAEFLK